MEGATDALLYFKSVDAVKSPYPESIDAVESPYPES